MITINKEEIEKKITEIELAEDIDELKDAIVRLTRTLVDELRRTDWEEGLYFREQQMGEKTHIKKIIITTEDEEEIVISPDSEGIDIYTDCNSTEILTEILWEDYHRIVDLIASLEPAIRKKGIQHKSEDKSNEALHTKRDGGKVKAVYG